MHLFDNNKSIFALTSFGIILCIILAFVDLLIVLDKSLTLV